MTMRPESAISHRHFQDAIARILTEPEFLEHAATGQYHVVRERFGLTEGETAALASVSPAALRRFRRVLQSKRLGMAESLVPVTVGILKASRGPERLAADFWIARPPVADDAAEAFRESIVRDFLAYTQSVAPAQRPHWLPDLARYEAMRALLRCREPAGADGRAMSGASAPAVAVEPRAEALPDVLALSDGVVCLAPGVMLDRFEYDVVTLLPALAQARSAAGPDPAGPDPVGPDATSHSCQVVAWRRHACPVQAWRLGPVAFEVLRACQPGARIRDIAEAVEASGTAPPRAREGTAGVIRQALRAGIISMAGAAGEAG